MDFTHSVLLGVPTAVVLVSLGLYVPTLPSDKQTNQGRIRLPIDEQEQDHLHNGLGQQTGNDPGVRRQDAITVTDSLALDTGEGHDHERFDYVLEAVQTDGQPINEEAFWRTVSICNPLFARCQTHVVNFPLSDSPTETFLHCLVAHSGPDQCSHSRLSHHQNVSRLPHCALLEPCSSCTALPLGALCTLAFTNRRPSALGHNHTPRDRFVRNVAVLGNIHRLASKVGAQGQQ